MMMMNAAYRGRFAPSPTGELHAGSLLAALGSWLLARHAGGSWLVRIEDLDPPREVPGAADSQLRTLQALGLVPDGPVQRQSERSDLYRQALQRLRDAGLAFACHCSRADLAGHGGVHRHCVSEQPRALPAWRLRVADDTRIAFVDALQGPQQQDVARDAGDVVLRRADGLWAYQLAVVVDDAEQGITHVVRGADLLDSTPRQILLQRALGLPTPAYTHLPLLVDADGRKLSKSAADLPVDAGDPLPALRMAWVALGQELRSVPRAGSATHWLKAASASFDPQRLPDLPAIDCAALHNAQSTASP